MKVIVKALVHWFWVLLICIVIGVVGGKEVAKLLPPTYQATSIIQLNGHAGSSSAIQSVAAYGTLVTSDSVLGAALKNFPDLTPGSIGSKQLVVNPANSSQTISIQVTLSNAKEAADLANDLAQSLVQQQNATIKAQLEKQLQIVNGQIDSINKNINALNQAIIKLSVPPDGPTQNAAQIAQDQNQVNQYQQQKTQYVSQQQNLSTDLALYSNPLSVVQAAVPPTKPSSITGSLPLFPVILLIMLLVGLGLIAFLEPNTGRINGVYALQKKVASPVLGALRWTSPGPQSIPLRTLIDSKKPFSEDCRVMMADVLFHAEHAQAHILAITGLKVRSGNSTVASTLAALLAQSKRRVLLIDANLYEPVDHKRLGVPNDAGLAKMLEELRTMKASLAPDLAEAPVEISQKEALSMMETRRVAGVSLSGQRPIKQLHQSANGQNVNGASNAKFVDITDRFPFDSYIQTTSIQNLYLLPAGKTSLNPSSLLSMPEVNQFLHWASKPIDFIVIDCPSLVHAEAHILGALSDQTYLVLDATKDRLRQVVNAKEELISNGVKLSGLVVNKLGRWI